MAAGSISEMFRPEVYYYYCYYYYYYYYYYYCPVLAARTSARVTLCEAMMAVLRRGFAAAGRRNQVFPLSPPLSRTHSPVTWLLWGSKIC
jgi:hypothetical protein